MRAVIFIALMLAAPPAAADWRAAVWGAQGAQAGADAKAISPGLVYGGGLTARVQGRERISALEFRALWQFDDAGLRQVMLERRGPQATPADAAALFDALAEALGPPDMICTEAPAGGRPGAAELIWRLHDAGPGGVLHAVWFDFSTTEAFERTIGDVLNPFPELPPLGTPDIDPERARADRRAIRGQSPDYMRGGLRASKAPRRLLVRWHDPAARRLGSRRCP